jgi:hypothetical protein
MFNARGDYRTSCEYLALSTLLVRLCPKLILYTADIRELVPQLRRHHHYPSSDCCTTNFLSHVLLD